MDLIEVLQQIFQNGTEQLKLCDLEFGTVTSMSPFKVQIESTMQPIPEAALVRTFGVMPRSYTGTTSDGASFTCVINPGLSVGDKVVMLRCAGGQRFIVLSKVY